MSSISSRSGSKLSQQVPYRLSGFGISGWASALFRRLETNCVLAFVIATLLLCMPAESSAENKELSSRYGFIGGGIFDTVKTCPKIELRWMQSLFPTAPTAYIRTAVDDLVIGQGMGALSPNCKHFWFVPFEITPGSVPNFVIFDAESLGVGSPIEGSFPVWLDNSSQIVVVRGDYPEVHLYSIETGKSRSLFAPRDSQPCAQLSDGTDWRPPKIISPTQIEFTYAKKVEKNPAVDPNEEFMKPAKTVLIDLATGAVLKTTQSKLECEYYSASQPRGRGRRS